ncbi:MAG: rhomboid family intramembrane serine protease [Chloroflexota bacterium]|nr:rhomboid family intramembrane serine protease [Chloroflexota bacterium]
MSQQIPQSPPPQRPVGFRLPMSKTRWTYILMAINVIAWFAMTAFGYTRAIGLNGSQSTEILLTFGAQQNWLVAQGEFYRLLTSMFLHIGIMHLAFNTWALYIIGRDVEALYGSTRFLTIYLISGLGGSAATLLLSGGVVSAGASGAIFGLIGAEIAYFRTHKELFGERGQARLRNLLFIAGINLVFGFTMPGINNIAHIGGLLFGLVLGWLLVPNYGLPDQATVDSTGNVTLADSASLQERLIPVILVIGVLAAIVVAGTVRWRNADTPMGMIDPDLITAISLGSAMIVRRIRASIPAHRRCP